MNNQHNFVFPTLPHNTVQQNVGFMNNHQSFVFPAPPHNNVQQNEGLMNNQHSFVFPAPPENTVQKNEAFLKSQQSSNFSAAASNKAFPQQKSKKRKLDIDEKEDKEVFDNLDGMMDNGIKIKGGYDKENYDVSNYDIMCELRLNRRKLNRIYNLLKEKYSDETSPDAPFDFPISTTQKLIEIENMLSDDDFKDKLVRIMWMHTFCLFF